MGTGSRLLRQIEDVDRVLEGIIRRQIEDVDRVAAVDVADDPQTSPTSAATGRCEPNDLAELDRLARRAKRDLRG